jgi:hypothetical protein
MFYRIAELQPLFLGLVLAWAGGYKLTARAAREAGTSTMARLVGQDRVRTAYRLVGGAELIVATLLLMPPGTALEGWLAVAMTAGFVAYVGYARLAAPDSSCGCLSTQEGPVTWLGLARAGLLLAAALTATVARGPWHGMVAAAPVLAATILGGELALFLLLSPELRRPVRRMVGWAQGRLVRHPLADVTGSPLAAALAQLQRSPIYCANAALLRSDVQDAWRAGAWHLVSYAGRVDDRPVTVVFAVPDDRDADPIRMSIVDDLLHALPR